MEAWVLRGAVPSGAPHPTAELAGPAGGGTDSAEERKERCLLTVRDWTKRYGDLISVPVTVRDFYSVPRVVEIGVDILEALDELEHALARVTAYRRRESGDDDPGG